MTGEEIKNGTAGVVVVADAGNVAGRVVYWRLAGTVEHEVLVDAWAEADLDLALLPSPPSPLHSLRRTMAVLTGTRSKRRLLVRPLGRGVDGFALVHEAADGRDLEHATILTASISDERTEAGTPILDVRPGPALNIIDLDAAGWANGGVQRDVQRQFGVACMEHDPGATSYWLTNLLPKMNAVSLRDKGGVYFLPRDMIPVWDRMVEVIRSVSDHAIFQLPAMQTQDAVDAILDAVTQEAKTLATSIERELNDGEELGKRALQTRVRYCDEMRAKLDRYAELLDTKLDDIDARLDSLKANVAQAILMAEAEEGAHE
jgi:hypothetical protein